MGDHPFLGFGYGQQIAGVPLLEGYQSGALVLQGGRLGYAHNTFLDVGLQMGYVGLALFVWLIAAVIVVLWRAWRAAPPGPPRALTAAVFAVALAFPVRAMTNNYFADDPVILLWFLIALALAAVPGAAPGDTGAAEEGPAGRDAAARVPPGRAAGAPEGSEAVPV
jgi:O-antigen ligase